MKIHSQITNIVYIKHVRGKCVLQYSKYHTNRYITKKKILRVVDSTRFFHRIPLGQKTAAEALPKC